LKIVAVSVDLSYNNRNIIQYNFYQSLKK